MPENLQWAFLFVEKKYMRHWIWKSYNRVTRPREEQRVVSSKHHLARFQIAESITFAYNSQKNHPGASYTSNGENEIRNYFLLFRTEFQKSHVAVSQNFWETTICVSIQTAVSEKKIHKSDWKFILNVFCLFWFSNENPSWEYQYNQQISLKKSRIRRFRIRCLLDLMKFLENI